MNKGKIQHRSLFLRNALSFAVIFILLGLIVNGLLKSSLYKNVDNELLRLSRDENYLQRQINGTDVSLYRNGNYEYETNVFQTQVILWTNDNKIANKDALGNLNVLFQSLKVKEASLNKIETVSIKVQSDEIEELRFRSLLLATNQKNLPYIQLITNTNTLEDSLSYFQKVLVMCMFVFWLISLLVSNYLAKWNIQPIMKSWKKQQEFVENASHELRTPLTIIQTKLEKLFIHPDHTIIEESEDIALALNEVKRLGQLTESLLMLARTDSDTIVVKKEPVNIHDLMLEVVNPFIEIAGFNDKQLSLNNETSVTVNVDKNLFKQLMVILLDNALKYTQPGDQVVVSSRLVEKKLQVEVKDTGIGIKTENLDELFERFYRDDKARSRETGGNGLGLSIAKWIVTLHDGKIKAEKNKEKGSTFTLTLPTE